MGWQIGDIPMVRARPDAQSGLMHSFRSRSLLGAAVISGALLAPSVASADSIVYADQGNIWSARPDGSGKLQLTTGGSWHSPTQADDGTIAAVQGTGPIVVMAKDGRPIRTITTAPAKSGDGGTFAPRPVQLSFSPDGSKIAYAYVAGSCPVGSTCGTIQRSTFYTRADVTEATPIAQWGNQFSVSDPEWVTNDRTLVFGGFGSQVSIDDLGPGDYSQRAWMTPNADQGDGELSRDGKRLVTTFLYGADKRIAWFVTSGDPRTEQSPAQPLVACNTATGDERVGDPSFSPDGSATAFNSSEGIEVVRFTAMSDNRCEVSGVTTLSSTGSDPDWGPADPATARYQAPSGGVQNGGSLPGPGTGSTAGDAPVGVDTGTPRVVVTAAGAAKQRFKRSVSVICSASVAGSCTATATVKVGKRSYAAKATASVAPGKVVTLKPTFSKRHAAAIVKAIKAGKKLTAQVTLSSGDGTATRAVTLKR